MSYLWTLPMYNCNGWCFTWGVTSVGGKHVCLREIRPGEILQLVREERISHFCSVPAVLRRLAAECSPEDTPFPQAVNIMVVGSPPSAPIIEAMEDFFDARLIHAYGLTETYGPHALCAWHPEWDNFPAQERYQLKMRQGVPLITSGEAEVKNTFMSPAEWDGETHGEIMMRGNTVMAGYYENEAATEEVFEGGWFHSGDIAVTHPDGYIEVRDRVKDIIVSGGEHISALEVEKTIATHPDVRKVAVIAVPDEKWGEVPKAYVVVKDGRELTEDDVIEHVRDRIAHFKALRDVEFGPLPKSSNGKVQKYLLREREWTNRERRVN